MDTCHKRSRLALRLALGALLAASAVLGAGAATAEQPRPLAICSASSELSPTGRQYATVRPSGRDPSICIRAKLGGSADVSVPDCWRAARMSGLSCVQIVDE
jgi:hypothetical protein